VNAPARTPLSSLVGARIRRIDAPEISLLALSLFAPELRSVLLVSFAQPKPGVGLVSDRPHGRAANAFVQKLRKEAEGARIVQFEQRDGLTLALALQRAEVSLKLVCDFARASVHLERGEQVLITASFDAGSRGKPRRVAWPESVEELTELGPQLLSEQASAGLGAQQSELDRSLRSAQKRLQRRLSALAEDAARIDQVGSLRTRAQLLLTQQHAVKRGQTSVQLVDYGVDPPATLEIALDPARTLQEQIDGWFKQAKRFERGAQVAAERKRQTEREIELLGELREQVATAEELAELQQIAARARALGVRGLGLSVDVSGKAAQPAPGRRHQRRVPYREFHGDKDRVILVGKGAADNDELTRAHARPQDLWLHARSVSGAHVVVPLERNETCPQELLIDAAHLAAHFSSARGETSVEVSYTPKRYVRKPKGAAIGAVLLEREKVVVLQLEAARLAKLLTTERSA
jgi:predicted ribosome quality control (RQC) complex YloA/Tae2 family protein